MSKKTCFFIFSNSWKKADYALEIAIKKVLADLDLEDISAQRHVSIQSMPLRFYSKTTLVKVDGLESKNEFPVYIALPNEGGSPFYLNGNSEVIHDLNAKRILRLTKNNVKQYLQYFCLFVQGDEGSFHIVDSPNSPLIDENMEIQEALKQYPTSLIQKTNQDDWLIDATVLYGNVLFRSRFRVKPNGFVSMERDKALCQIESTIVPKRFDKPNKNLVQVFQYSHLKKSLDNVPPDKKAQLQTLIDKLTQNRGYFPLVRIAGKLGKLEELKLGYPHMSHCIDWIIGQLVRAQFLKDGAIHLSPLLLFGPPGTGKTNFIKSAFNILDVPYEDVDFSTASASFILKGGNPMWHSASIGKVVEALISYQRANIGFRLEEIDKCNSHSQYPILNTLFTLLEPTTAKEFKDEFIGSNADCSHIIWMATANDIHKISPAIRSRFHCVEVALPNFNERKSITCEMFKSYIKESHAEEKIDANISDECISMIARSNHDLRLIMQCIDRAVCNAIQRHRRLLAIAEPRPLPLTLLPIDVQTAVSKDFKGRPEYMH